MSNVYYENDEGKQLTVHYVIMKNGVMYAIIDYNTKESMLWDDVVKNYKPMCNGKPHPTYYPIFMTEPLNNFEVICDETNNTPETILRNEIHATINIKPFPFSHH